MGTTGIHMRSILAMIGIGCATVLTAQQNVRLYSEQTPVGYIVCADNDEYCPISLELDYQLTNLRVSEKSEKIVVIPPRSEKVVVAELVIVEKGKLTALRYAVKANYGDHHQTSYEDDFVYHLPYKQGEAYVIGQGYKGSFSHKNEYALDFNMPVGTEIYASRGGIVCKVVESNSRRCPEQECAKYNNYIRVYHSDGTFAEYTHIKKDGALVNEGDEIAKGELIGYSGNVGWASGPHLHFMVFLQRLDRRESLETRFLLSRGALPENLIEKRTYLREYE